MRFLLFLVALSAPLLAQNLDFEKGEPGTVPPGWFVPPQLRAAGFNAVTTRDGCRTGACALITVPEIQPATMFGNLMATLDAAPRREKRFVLRAAIRVEGEGRAQMWLRVDRSTGGMGFFDNMMDRPIQVGPWAFYEIRGTVDADARSLNYGVMVLGNARGWVDDVSLEFTDPPPDAPERREISQRYALMDAAYATNDFTTLLAMTTPDAQTGAQGRKTPLRGKIEEARMLSATVKIQSDTRLLSVERIDSKAMARTRTVLTLAQNGVLTRMEVTNADVWLNTQGVWLLHESTVVTRRALDPPADPAIISAVVGELKKAVTPLISVEAGQPTADLGAFGKAVGDARVVALGEATHGTREIFQMKHRLLEYLVREKGFTVFAIEANWPESEAVDRYIKTGVGDPKAALAGMYFWTWQTQEVLAMVEWMRAFNQAPGQHPILSFTAFDMQTHKVAYMGVLDYCREHAADVLPVAEAAYTALAKQADPADIIRQAETVVSLLASKRGSSAAFRDALQRARIVAQALRAQAPGAATYGFRDQMMAQNVEWLLHEAHPKEKMVLWAHNGHVTTDTLFGQRRMGSWLRESLREQMYVLGFAIHAGTVRAQTMENGKRIGLRENSLPLLGFGSGSATLNAAGHPLFFLDLRGRSGPLGAWLAEPHRFRECGAIWDRDYPDSQMSPTTLSKSYDGLIYLRETHSARGI